MKKFSILGLIMLFASGFGATAADYGLPTNIQDCNILHCFDWSCAQVESELDNIAAAGFGAVQLSPIQGSANTGAEWYYCYLPYDLKIISNGIGNATSLTSLCTAAHERGIKVIVDVVANHVNGSASYRDPWWDENGRQRWNGSIDYGNRYSITHGQLGGYGDINSEDSEVQARAKAHVEALKACGVDGIRWDAAKHIGLPSEGCNFWSTVTSVSGMWHYGEILDSPGGDGNSVMKEYTNYISVTDNGYCDGVRSAVNGGGVPSGYAGWAAGTIADNKVVYWAESHDDYSNEWQASTNISQAVIDRTWAIIACRNGASSLYFSRPFATTKDAIKVGVKGSTNFTSNHIAAVNKLRNKAVGAADYFSSSNGVVSVTRKGVGATIVKGSGSGSVSIANGGGYCPTGTYVDQVSGATFTVTASTISGNVGSSGIAVLVIDGEAPDTGDDNTGDDNTGDDNTGGNTSGTVTITGDYNIAYSGNHTHVHYWGGSSQSSWPGVAMTTVTGSDGNTYKVAKIDASSTGCLFDTNGSTQTGDLTYTGSYVMNDNGATSTAVVFSNGGGNDSGDDSGSTTTGYYVYLKNTANWSNPTVWAWDGNNNDANCCSNSTWPGDAMTAQSDGLYKWTAPSGKVPTMIIFSNSGTPQTDDLTFVNGATYDCSGNIVSTDNPDDGGNTGGGNTSGTVTITGDYNIAYSGNHTHVHYWGGTSATEWPGVALATATGSDGNTYKVAKVADGTTGIVFNTNGSTQTDDLTYTGSYVMNDNGATSTAVIFSNGGDDTDDDSGDDNTGGDDTGDDNTGGNDDYVPSSDKSLNTQYYKTNPNGKVGSNKTINISGHPASNALSNWTDAELIAQGVARDVAQAMKGNHERPIVDSYALYAAYDSENLYLGVQFVYTVWDLYGEGKQPGESKPYNMDGRLMIAFDLDPNKSFDGYINGTKAIWNDEGAPGAKFDNGVDAVWIGSTKPGVGTPGFFIPTADGHASYDAAYCKTSTVSYGYADGLLPSITNVYGQESFNYNASALETNDGFADLSSKIDASAHTFYEFKIPLSLLGVTESYITNTGIGVQYLDIYGSSPIGGTPYDPSFFDNVASDYSMDPSSSMEKEDEDIITYSLARIGKLSSTSGIQDVVTGDDTLEIYTKNGRLYINAQEDAIVTIVSADGRMIQRDIVAGMNVIEDLPRGFYIVNQTKVIL